jgi:hypothetical protein
LVSRQRAKDGKRQHPRCNSNMHQPPPRHHNRPQGHCHHSGRKSRYHHQHPLWTNPPPNAEAREFGGLIPSRQEVSVALFTYDGVSDSSTREEQIQGASKVQCEDIPIDCSLVEATDEFVKAVADATAATKTTATLTSESIKGQCCVIHVSSDDTRLGHKNSQKKSPTYSASSSTGGVCVYSFDGVCVCSVDGVCSGFASAVEVSFETGATESGKITLIVSCIAVRASSMVLSSLDPNPSRDPSSIHLTALNKL